MDKYELAAALTLANLDGFTGKLPAETQREVFGKVAVGKKTVGFDCDGQGTVTISKSVGFGMDREMRYLSFDEFISQYL